MQNSRTVPPRAGSHQRALHVALTTALAGLVAHTSHAAPASHTAKPSAKSACEATHSQLDEAERQGHLQAAKELALGCSVPACGEWLAQQCRTRFQALSVDIPTVIPIVLDEKGAPLRDAELRIDGTLCTSPLNGPALPIDPGIHELAFSAPGREPRVEKLAILQGAKNRQLSMVLVAAQQATPASTGAALPSPVSPSAAPPVVEAPSATPALHTPAAGADRTSIWPYVVGGVGLAALGSSVAFATWGHHDFELLDACSPNCKQDSLDHVRSMYIAADISLGVGAVALGVATWLYFSEPASAAPANDRAALRLDVQPVRGGAFATLRQAF
jgi:hypothetical protein